MKRFATILMVLLCLHSVCIASCLEKVREFYIAYLNNILQNGSDGIALCDTYLTEELISKVDRLKYATGADPIIRAQDVNKDVVATLSVEDLANDWYMVKYFWKKGDNRTLTEIPVKAQNINGYCKITYITPVWNGTNYGDKVLTCRNKNADAINQTSELSFLKSFYATYISEYCDMPKELNIKLSALRSLYLSQNALQQFEKAALENAGDGLVGYDLLIDNFDFDCLWCQSVEITHLQENNYQIAYQVGNKVYKVVVTIKKKDNNYLIDKLNE